MFNKEILDLLCKDHNNRFTEMRDHMSRYNTHINVVHIFISALAAIIIYLFSEKGNLLFLGFGKDNGPLALGILLVFLAIILYYLVASMMDALFMTYANGVRMGMIENLINNMLGEDILIWETRIIKDIHGINSWLYKGWIKPNHIIAVWIGIIIVAATSILIFIWNNLVKDYALYYSYFVLFLMGFHMLQWYYLNTSAIEYLSDVMDRSINDSTLNKTKAATIFLISPSLASFFTIYIGVLPIILMSISLNAFWYNSTYDYPFLMIPSVFIGDTFIIPIANYFIFKYIGEYSIYLYSNKKAVILIIMGTLTATLAVNIILNYIWVSDTYLGFMDVKYGTLSIAGWWHFLFSVFEETLFGSVFLSIFYLSKKSIHGLYKNIYIVVKILFSFSLLSIGDMIFKAVRIYHMNYIAAISADLYSFSSIIMFGILIIYCKLKINEDSWKDNINTKTTINQQSSNKKAYTNI